MKIFNIILAATLLSGVAFAQNQKSESSIQLSFSKKTDNSKVVSALVMEKNKANKFVPAINAHVSFYAKREKDMVLITRLISDMKGKTDVGLPNDLPLDADRFFTIVVKVENDSLYEDAEENLHLKDVNLTIKFNQQHDTTRAVTAIVTEIASDGNVKPVKDIPINFYVQRLFGVMPAADDHAVNTDEKGIAVYSYPKGIPGDTAGIITVVAMIEGNDTYGTVESKTTRDFGKIVPVDKDPFPRALWSPHAMWGLITTLTILYGGVWSSYIFMAFQLRKIKKEGELEINN